jgi:hypothetical protein
MKKPNRSHRRSHQLVATLVAALLAQAAFTSPGLSAIRSMSLSQAIQLDEPVPTVRTFIQAVDEHGNPGASIRTEQLFATLGDKHLQLREAYPFGSRGQGVAYVFLVDISASLSLREFELILEALDVWILSLRPADRVAVIAFGDESRIVVDFTGDRQAIQAGLYSLGPSDNRTVLHEALEQGLELCSRRDPDLPGRRVMMVLTDGRDEGSGLTMEDVLDSLRLDPVPIYAIGVSRIKSPPQRRRYLDVLRRFSANSGGTFHEASTSALGEAYESIRRAIHGVTVADFSCPTCRTDGQEYRLQVQMNDSGRVLSSGRSLRLYPVTRQASPGEAMAQSSGSPTGEQTSDPGVDFDETRDDAEAAAETDARGDTGTPSPNSAGIPLWLWLVAAAVLVCVAWLTLRRRKSGPPPEAPNLPPATPDLSAPAERPESVEILDSDEDGEPQTPSPPLEAPQTYTTASGLETTRPPRPALMRLVRLIVVRGTKPGRQYTLTLFKNAVVGSRSTCDCVLVDPGVAPKQFELLQHDGRVYIRNLTITNPTLVDGLNLTERYPMKSGSLVGNRDFILRIVYEDARPINT